MAIPSSLLGASTETFVHEVDARWLMAYSAALGAFDACYLDTLAPEGIVAHPLFPVCPEWPVVLAVRDVAARSGVPLDELRRGVHATHDLHLHRAIRPGDVLSTVGSVVGVEARPPGAYVLMRLDSTDAAGEPVATTWQGSLYLGTAVDGPDGHVEAPPPAPGTVAPGSDDGVDRDTGPARRRRSPRLHGVRPDLEPHPHRSRFGAARRPAGDHPARHRHPRAGGLRGRGPLRRRRSHPGAAHRGPVRWDGPAALHGDRRHPPAHARRSSRWPCAPETGGQALRDGFVELT